MEVALRKNSASFRLELTCHDRPGLLAEVTRRLADSGLSIAQTDVKVLGGKSVSGRPQRRSGGRGSTCTVLRLQVGNKVGQYTSGGKETRVLYDVLYVLYGEKKRTGTNAAWLTRCSARWIRFDPRKQQRLDANMWCPQTYLGGASNSPAVERLNKGVMSVWSPTIDDA
eukprot:4457132-Pyramimonas_sp.AAC.1